MPRSTQKNRRQDVKEKSEFKLYTYCLMGNHLHLLLKEKGEPLELIFKRTGFELKGGTAQFWQR